MKTRMMNLSWLIILFPMFGGCSDGSDKAPKLVRKPSASPLTSLALTRDKVDGANLKVVNTSVAKIKKHDIFIGSLNYATMGGADYVKFKACSEDGNCFEGKSPFNRVEMPPLSGGAVSITLQACADPDRMSSGVACGPESTYNNFLQPANADSKKVSLLSERAGLLQRLTAYGDTVVSIMARYEIEIQKCQAKADQLDEINARRQMINSYIAFGASLISSGFGFGESACPESTDSSEAEAGAGTTTTQPVNTGSSTTILALAESVDTCSSTQKKNPPKAQNKPKKLGASGGKVISKSDTTKAEQAIIDAAEKLENFEGYSNLSANLLASAGAFQGSPTGGGLQGLTSAVLEVMNPTSARPDICLADSTAKSEIDEVKRETSELKARISQIDNELSNVTGGSL